MVFDDINPIFAQCFMILITTLDFITDIINAYSHLIGMQCNDHNIYTINAFYTPSIILLVVSIIGFIISVAVSISIVITDKEPVEFEAAQTATKLLKIFVEDFVSIGIIVFAYSPIEGISTLSTISLIFSVFVTLWTCVLQAAKFWGPDALTCACILLFILLVCASSSFAFINRNSDICIAVLYGIAGTDTCCVDRVDSKLYSAEPDLYNSLCDSGTSTWECDDDQCHAYIGFLDDLFCFPESYGVVMIDNELTFLRSYECTALPPKTSIYDDQSGQCRGGNTLNDGFHYRYNSGQSGYPDREYLCGSWQECDSLCCKAAVLDLSVKEAEKTEDTCFIDVKKCSTVSVL
eukprot:844340_1